MKQQEIQNKIKKVLVESVKDFTLDIASQPSLKFRERFLKSTYRNPRNYSLTHLVLSSLVFFLQEVKVAFSKMYSSTEAHNVQ